MNEQPRADAGTSAQIHLRAAGVSVVLGFDGRRLPVVRHWGADLGDLSADSLAELVRGSVPPRAPNTVDQAVPVGLLREGADGWTGTPGVSGHRNGTSWSPSFEVDEVSVDTRPGDGGRVVVTATDRVAELRVEAVVELMPSGLVRSRAALTNTDPETYTLDALTMALPVPPQADEILDLAGRWGKERVPQRRPFTVGTHLRASRHGKSGPDSPFLTVTGPAGFGFRGGEVWAVHVAWSGNQQTFAERDLTGERLIGGGELLLPGEVSLAEGATYTTPWLYGAYGIGMDELAARFHRTLRARPQHPRSPRPVVLNVWEALYFDHNEVRMRELADLGAKVGVERFVVDDGWFRRRRDDSAGLGDWYHDESVWPRGLGPFAEHVRGLGMEFGLWFEPEMINPDSDLARAHPEWIMQVPGRLPLPARHQQVLDLAHPGAFTYLHERIVGLVRELGIDFIKWDHNRDLVDAGSTLSGRAGVHEQTVALYRLLDSIRADCPGLEIESCASGGGRIDLEILERTDRVWASDCIDAIDRQQIQRWTAQLLPAELVGSHVGQARSHTTGRRHELSFRAATALFGHFGIEWDLAAASDAEREELASWVALYKEHRALLHSGTTVRADLNGLGVWMHGVVSTDRSEALYAVVTVDRPATWPPGRLRLDGLDPERTYRVRPIGEPIDGGPQTSPPWLATPLLVSGAVLGTVGIQVPALHPDHIALLHVREESS